MFITTMITFQHDQLHFYLLPFITFSIFTIYYAFIASFIAICKLGIFIAIDSIYYERCSSFITIYSIYYQGNLEMFMDPRIKENLKYCPNP